MVVGKPRLVIPQFIRGIQAIFLILLLSSCSNHGARNPIPDYMKPEIMVVSVSSDGDYAVTSDLYQHIVLWNLKNHTYKIIAKKANTYSAYFIRNTNDFIYQSNTDNTVYVENTDGKMIKTFNPGFASYGEVMTSDLQRYFAADEQFNVYQIENNVKTQIFVPSCMNGMTGAVYKGPLLSACTDFASSGKLLNLTLSPDDKTLIAGDGLGHLFVWHVLTNKNKKYETNGQFIFPTFSPNGEYILSGDDNAHLLLYSATNTTLIKSLRSTYNPETKQNFNTEWQRETNDFIGSTTCIKFIDHAHYLVIFNMDDVFMQGGFHYAGLFSLDGTKAIKYLDLLNGSDPNQPQPVTQSYLRDQAIDTSPSAHILVMAQADQNGIIVYQYDPETQTLKQVWAPVIPKTSWWKFWG